MCRSLKQLLEGKGFTVSTANSAKGGLNTLQQQHVREGCVFQKILITAGDSHMNTLFIGMGNSRKCILVSLVFREQRLSKSINSH